MLSLYGSAPVVQGRFRCNPIENQKEQASRTVSVVVSFCSAKLICAHEFWKRNKEPTFDDIESTNIRICLSLHGQSFHQSNSRHRTGRYIRNGQTRAIVHSNCFQIMYLAMFRREDGPPTISHTNGTADLIRRCPQHFKISVYKAQLFDTNPLSYTETKT